MSAQGQHDKAFEDYRKCLKLNSDHLQAQFGEGQMYLKKGMIKTCRDFNAKWNALQET